jgi:DNA-binding beta-propeller fold protein YncE
MGRLEIGINVLLGLLAVLAAGCAPLPPAYQPALGNSGEIRVYLQPLPQEAHRIVFSVTAIGAVREGGAVVPLQQSLVEWKGKELIGKQRLVASAQLPPGAYEGLALEIAAASVISDAGPSDLLVPDEPLLVEFEFTITRRLASALFLSLAPDDLVPGGFQFAPTFSLAKPRRQLRSMLGFATNSRSNVVSVFNKFSMEVVDTIATSSGPKGLALDQLRGWVYVALAGDDAVEVIDVTTGEILRRGNLNFGDEPVEIALTPDGRNLITANRGTNTASILDASSLREVGRVQLPSEPTSVAMSRSEPRAFVFQPQSNVVSVIDLERREVITTRTLEESPIRGAVSADGSSLYVITRNSPNLVAIDATSLITSGRIFVGTGAGSIQEDPRSGLLYVGKNMGEVSVIEPSLSTPIDRFRVDGRVVWSTIDNEENALFVVLPDSKRIWKMDLISQKLLGSIEVEEGCYGVVVMGER